MQARYHMWKYGTTQRQIAIVAAKNHCNGNLNSNAQYRFKMTPEEILSDREITYPFTRSMCAPVGDGAAAAILCNEDYYRNLPRSIRARAIKVMACSLTSGKYRDKDEIGLSRIAADKAYEAAGIAPEDIDVVEVHDATAYSEIYQSEMLRFCRIGEGGGLAESGESQIGGRIPINTSGGLISKGYLLEPPGFP